MPVPLSINHLIDNDVLTDFYSHAPGTPHQADSCWPYTGSIKVYRESRIYALVPASKMALTIALGRDIALDARQERTCVTKNCINPNHQKEIVMTTKKVSKVRRKKKDQEPPKPVLTPALEERLCTAARITLGLSRNGYKAKYGSDPDEAAKILVANNVDVEELLSRP